METRVEISHGTEVPRRARSLDLKSLYRSKSASEAKAENPLVEKSFEDAERIKSKRKRKRSRKVVCISSLKNVYGSSNGSGKSVDKVCNGGSDSGLHDREASKSGLSQKLDSEFNSVSQLCLGDSGIQIPRKKRGFVGRKKIEGGQALKILESVLALPADFRCRGEGCKTEKNKGLDECKGSTNTELNAASHAKKENGVDSPLFLRNGNASLKRSWKKSRKSKVLSSDSRTDAKEFDPLVNSINKACQASHEDEEENLEENAAMMLSSRFDPICSGFSLNSKACVMQSLNGVSIQLSPGQDFENHMSKSLSGSESPSADNAAENLRLRPRTQHKEKKGTGKRRHFYELNFKGLDACWIVNRKIKIFWPLDQSWYYGVVNDYDKDKKLHHIRYDDRKEEWIDLRHKRFKLLLLPTEVPGKSKQKKSVMRITSSGEREENLKPRKEKKKDT